MTSRWMTLLARCAASCLVGLAVSVAVAADPVFPPSSSVGLEPPPGMRVADGFLGFEKGQASIVIANLSKTTFPEIDRKSLAAKIEGAQITDFPVAGSPGFIIRGKQTTPDGRAFRQWMVVFGTAKEATALTAQVPVNDLGVTDTAIETALRTIVIRERPGLDEQIASLPFLVGDRAGFRPFLTELGASVALTQGPKDVDPDGSQPQVAVFTSLKNPPTDVAPMTFAKAVLKGYDVVAVSAISAEKVFEAGGARWAEIEATGTRGKAKTPVGLSFFIRFDEHDYITIVGTAPVAEQPGLVDRFRALALSVKPKG